MGKYRTIIPQIEAHLIRKTTDLMQQNIMKLQDLSLKLTHDFKTDN